MVVFIGLGNVGAQYADTKHNAGFWVVDELARRWSLTFKPGRGAYVYAPDERREVLLAKPTTGMNASGVAVKQLVHQWEVPLKNLYVILDDVDLPLGSLRLRPKGGDGCHRGMASVIYQLGDQHFPRLRVGIATAERTRPAERFVLKPFRKKDLPLGRMMVQLAADAVEMILEQGLEQTMTHYNRMEKTDEVH